MNGNALPNDKDLINFNLTREENIRIERLFIVNFMRMWADNFALKKELIYIPDECEKFGFAEGNFEIGQMLRFFADMLEE